MAMFLLYINFLEFWSVKKCWWYQDHNYFCFAHCVVDCTSSFDKQRAEKLWTSQHLVYIKKGLIYLFKDPWIVAASFFQFLVMLLCSGSWLLGRVGWAGDYMDYMNYIYGLYRLYFWFYDLYRLYGQISVKCCRICKKKVLQSPMTTLALG